MRHPIPGLDYFPARVLTRRPDEPDAATRDDAVLPFRGRAGAADGEEPRGGSFAFPFPLPGRLSFVPPHRPKG